MDDGTNRRDRPCIVPTGYEEPLRRLKEKYGVTDVLLATDSPEAIEWASKYTELTVHYFDFSRNKLSSGGGSWIEHRVGELGSEEVEGTLLGLELLSYGHVFLGNMCSFYSMDAYNAMVGRRNTVVPFISVDGCALHNHNSIPFNTRRK